MATKNSSRPLHLSDRGSWTRILQGPGWCLGGREGAGGCEGFLEVSRAVLFQQRVSPPTHGIRIRFPGPAPAQPAPHFCKFRHGTAVPARGTCQRSFCSLRDKAPFLNAASIQYASSRRSSKLCQQCVRCCLEHRGSREHPSLQSQSLPRPLPGYAHTAKANIAGPLGRRENPPPVPIFNTLAAVVLWHLCWQCPSQTESTDCAQGRQREVREKGAASSLPPHHRRSKKGV